MLKWLMSLSLLLGFYQQAQAIDSSSKLHWLTNYDQAVEQARKQEKPLFLFFTGSDWCGWCHKLENEVLNTSEFAEKARNQFVFVVLDFPMKSKLDPQVAKQNKELQQKFKVKGYPTVIILDEEQQPIETTGYRPGGGKAYADYLLQKVNASKAYKQTVSKLGQRPFSSKELITLYGKAQELCRLDDALRIMHSGIRCNDNLFFLLERYRQLAKEGQLYQTEASIIKQTLLAKDPKNTKMAHYEIAVIDFETYAREMGQENYSVERAILPLLSYIEKFGNQDSANLWRLHMMISQVFLDENNIEKALQFAKNAHDSAPTPLQFDILALINHIEHEL
ncbi:Thioredoxin-related protein DsbJ [Chlamydiales bacterium STE3]|nr:Thioredoxin-related protein DsbJ [Chlamydiales bacterium STE3]